MKDKRTMTEISGSTHHLSVLKCLNAIFARPGAETPFSIDLTAIARSLGSRTQACRGAKENPL